MLLGINCYFYPEFLFFTVPKKVPLLLKEFRNRKFSDKEGLAPGIIQTLDQYEASRTASLIMNRVGMNKQIILFNK